MTPTDLTGPAEILARAVNPKDARDMGTMMWQNSVTNRAEADRLLEKWAGLARMALTGARSKRRGVMGGTRGRCGC
jgi:hypothetical protein